KDRGGAILEDLPAMAVFAIQALEAEERKVGFLDFGGGPLGGGQHAGAQGDDLAAVCLERDIQQFVAMVLANGADQANELWRGIGRAVLDEEVGGAARPRG